MYRIRVKRRQSVSYFDYLRIMQKENISTDCEYGTGSILKCYGSESQVDPLVLAIRKNFIVFVTRVLLLIERNIHARSYH